MKFTFRLLVGVIALALVFIVAVIGFTFASIETFPGGAAPNVSQVHNKQYESAANRAAAGLADLRRERHWPSVSMAVGLNGELVWSGAVGYADVEDTIAISTTHQYRVGSTAKSMTAVALGQLLDEGKITLDAKITDIIETPNEFAPISVYQLASHTAGIRHYATGLGGTAEMFHQTQYASVRDGLSLFASDPLEFVPGTGYRYSTFGYNLLSHVLETADGQDFLSLMRTRIFEPAGMTTTVAEHVANQDLATNKLATPYLMYDDVMLRAPEVNNSYKWAGGGFVSTPSDLVVFGLNLLTDNLVSRDTRDQLWTPAHLADGAASPESYGLGFRIGEDQGDAFVAHSGGSIGGNTYLIIYPELGLVAAMVSNTSALSGPWEIRHSTRLLARLFL